MSRRFHSDPHPRLDPPRRLPAQPRSQRRAVCLAAALRDAAVHWPAEAPAGLADRLAAAIDRAQPPASPTSRRLSGRVVALAAALVAGVVGFAAWRATTLVPSAARVVDPTAPDHAVVALVDLAFADDSPAIPDLLGWAAVGYAPLRPPPAELSPWTAPWQPDPDAP